MNKLLVLIMNDMVILPNNEVRIEYDNNLECAQDFDFYLNILSHKIKIKKAEKDFSKKDEFEAEAAVADAEAAVKEAETAASNANKAIEDFQGQLDGLATEEYVNEAISNIEVSGGGISDRDCLAALIETDMLPSFHNGEGKLIVDSKDQIILRF